MKKNIGVVATALLCVVLVFSIRELRAQVRRVQIHASNARTYSSAPTKLVLSSTAGVHPPNAASSIPSAAPDRTVACGLRGASMNSDLRVWSEVRARLPVSPVVHVVGYCDGPECREFVEHAGAMLLPVQVLAYAEPISVQAVAAADARNECFLLNADKRVIGRVAWRASDATPDGIVRSILK